MVHLHSTYSVAVSCLADVDPADVLPPLTAYYVMRVGRLPLLPYHAPGDDSLEPLAEATAADHHAFLLANHGPVVAGADLAVGRRRRRGARGDRPAVPAAARPPTRPLTPSRSRTCDRRGSPS